MDRITVASDMERQRVGEVFTSRKNRVFAVDIDGHRCVAKVFPQGAGDRASTEFSILGMCSRAGVTVPIPIWHREDVVLMDFVEGMSLAGSFDEIFEGRGGTIQAGSPTSATIIAGLADWLASFHTAFAFRMCRGDSILKNFKISEGKVCGFDFEEAHEGDPIEDLGQACAYVLSTRPEFTEGKFEFANRLADRYWSVARVDRSPELPDAVAAGLEHYAQFRADGSLLYDWAGRIRVRGMHLME